LCGVALAAVTVAPLTVGTTPALADESVRVVACSTASVAATCYLFLSYLAWRLLRGWARLACVTGLALLIGLSRLHLGVHYLTDVLAGYAAGFAWTDAVIIGGRLLARRTPSDGSLPGGGSRPV